MWLQLEVNFDQCLRLVSDFLIHLVDVVWLGQLCLGHFPNEAFTWTKDSPSIDTDPIINRTCVMLDHSDLWR